MLFMKTLSEHKKEKKHCPQFDKYEVLMNRNKLYLVITLCFLFANKIHGQILFNCNILISVLDRIKQEKLNIENARLIDGKFDIVITPNIGKGYYIRKNNEYGNDPQLDSIINLSNIDEILHSKGDSLFFLKGNIYIVDSLDYFTKQCNFENEGYSIFIVKVIREVGNIEKENIVDLKSVDNYRGYSAVSLQHRNSTSKKVIFLYQIENNQPIIKKLVVVRGED